MSRIRFRPANVRRWLLVGALPLLLCLGFSYLLSLYHFQQEGRSLAEAQAARIKEILRSADQALGMLAEATGGQCTDAAMQAMNHAVFHGVYFREAGIERDGDLICTNMQVLPENFTIPNARRAPAARVGNLEILSPTKTIMGGESLILNWPVDDARRVFVNLLLDPNLVASGNTYFEGMEGAVFLDDAPSGRFIKMGARELPAVLSGAGQPLAEGSQWIEGGIYVGVRAGAYPFIAVSAISHASVVRHWRTQMQPAVISGFLLSALGFWLLRRFVPRYDDVDDLRDGIEAGEIKVSYQPIVDARSGAVIGAEALARWKHPQRGLVMPDEFIPLAERHGLMDALTERVLTRILADLGALDDLPEGFRVNVNLARAQLADHRLLIMVDRLFGSGDSLRRLGFEITEREVLTDVADTARSVLDGLAQRGAKLSLDDFGTGYSGLSYLRHLKLHQLKIDRSFVHALDTEAVTASLVESIVGLARSLHLDVVAEGVETESQRARLLGLGVHLHQGWLYAKALTLDGLRGEMARVPALTAPEPVPA